MTDQPTHSQQRSPSQRLLAIAERLAARHSSLTMAELVDSMGRTGLGMTMLLLSVLALLPIPGPFGFLCGGLITLVAAQIMAGARRVWLPECLRKLSLSTDILLKACRGCVTLLSPVDRFLVPRRFLFLTGRLARVFLAVPLFAMAIALTLPIPFVNMMPALSLIAFSLAFVSRDGVAVIAGTALAIASIVWLILLTLFGNHILDRLLPYLPFT